MKRIKQYEPIVCTVFSTTTPTVKLQDPSGIVSTLTPVTDSQSHTVCVRPAKLGVYTIIADDQVFHYNVTSVSEIEERLGSGNPIDAQSYIHGTAPLGEFTTCYDVAAQPLWITKSRGSYVSPIIADTTDRTYLWHFDKLRIPHAGWVTGVRVRLVANLDASTVDIFQFIFFHGSAITAMSVRGRTENINKSRLVNAADGYAWVQFQKPVYCHGGEWLGLRVRTSSSTANTLRLHAIVPGAKVNELLSAAVSSDGLTVTGTNWSLAGVVAGDIVYMTNGSGTDADYRTVVSANTTEMVVTPAYSGTLTGRYVCVGDAVIAEYQKSGLVRINSNPSDTAANSINSDFTNYDLQSGFPGFFLMTRPVVALTGDSVMGGTGQTGGGTGTLHDHHVATSAYSQSNDMANWIYRFSGIPSVNASRGGSYIHVYMDKYDQSNPLWGYQNQQWSSVAEYRPAVVIYNSIHNDGNDFGIYIPTDAQYLAALDLLHHHCLQLGALLVLTTGTPVPSRAAEVQVRCRRFRSLTRHWCARNGVRLIDTERLFHVTQVDESTEDAFHDTTITTVFGRELWDYTTGDIHPNSSGSDGANAYKAMPKFMADCLMNPVMSQSMSQLWRIQTAPAEPMDQTQYGVVLPPTVIPADFYTVGVSNGGIVVSTDTNGNNIATVLNTADIIDAIDSLGDAVVIASPIVDQGLTIRIIEDNDYLLTDGRQIRWTGSVANQWPDLTDAELVFTLLGNDTTLEKDATVTTPTGSQVFYIELTRTETNISPKKYRYTITATLSNGSVLTLARGLFLVQSKFDPTPFED